MENFKEQQEFWKGSPVIPNGMLHAEIQVPLLQSHHWYQFQAFLASENSHFSSLLAAGETSSAVKSEEKRLFSQAEAFSAVFRKLDVTVQICLLSPKRWTDQFVHVNNKQS